MTLCSLFAAYKYYQWFKDPETAEGRGGLVKGWNVYIIGWVVSWLIVIIGVFVALNVGAGVASSAAKAGLDSVKDSGNDEVSKAAKKA
jgi:hypothetical protein